MAEDDEIASLRRDLARAERARDEALAETAALRQRWLNESREEQRRLRNLFSVIRAIVHRTADDVETADEYCGVLDGRLSAYLRTQAALMQDWHKGADLALLLAEALRTFELKEGDRVDLVGPPVRLTGQAAGIAALAFHELAFRAIVSDTVADARAHVQVRWQICDAGTGPTLLICWTEPSSSHQDHDEPPSSWVDWVEQAIRYQLAGTMMTETGGATRITQIRLPASVML